METVYAPHRQISKWMQNNSGGWSKVNLETSSLMEEENKKYWWMLRIHYAVLWYASPPKNGMIYDLLYSCFSIPHHKNSCRWNPSHINPTFFSRNKHNLNIMSVGDTILAAVVEVSIDENGCLLDNQPTWNAFTNGKYLSSIRDDHDEQYLGVHCNAGENYTKHIGDLSGYYNPVWYNPKGIYNIISLRLVQKHHLVTYNSQYGNEFVVHIPQRPIFKMTKAGLFYHNIRHLIQKNAHIIVNDSRPPSHKMSKRRNSTPYMM